MKKEMMKKTSAAVLAAAMAVSAVPFTALADGGSELPENYGWETGWQVTDRDETVTVTMGRYTTTNPMLPEGDTYEDNAWTRMCEEELNIDIVDEFEATSDDYDTQVSLCLSSGSMPDIMKVMNRADLVELYEAGMIYDLTELYEKYASDEIKARYAAADPGCGLESVTVDDQLLAIPGTGAGVYTLCFMRQDWIDELGLTVDEDGDYVITVSEVLDIAREFQKANPENVENPVGLASIPQLAWAGSEGAWALDFISSSVNSWPQTWLNLDGEVAYGSIQEETKEWLQICADLYAEGVLDQQVGTRQWDDVTSLLVNGELGIIFGAGHTPSWGLINVKKADPDAEFAAFVVSDDEGVVRHKFANNNNGGFVVSTECEHPEIAFEILNLVWGRELGIDDANTSAVMYEKYPEVQAYEKELGVDNSCKPYNLVVDYATDVKSKEALYEKYWAGEATDEDIINGEFTTESNLENLKKIQAVMDGETDDPTAWALYCKDYVATSKYLVYDRYENVEFVTPLSPDDTPTMLTNWANLEAMEQEYFLKIVTGVLDVEEGFNEFVEKWKAQGGEQITAEVAEQFGLTAQQ